MVDRQGMQKMHAISKHYFNLKSTMHYNPVFHIANKFSDKLVSNCINKALPSEVGDAIND